MATVALAMSATLASVPARAEMSKTDLAGQRAFVACLDETAGSEETCLDKLGYYAWYPRDDGACETVAATVGQSIAANRQTEWRDLFMNERCARLGMPHDREAAAAGGSDPGTGGTSPEGEASRTIFLSCLDKNRHDLDACFEKFGRHRWYDEDVHCGLTQNLIRDAEKNLETQSWMLLFNNERCHRRGVWHFEPTQGSAQ